MPELLGVTGVIGALWLAQVSLSTVLWAFVAALGLVAGVLSVLFLYFFFGAKPEDFDERGPL